MNKIKVIVILLGLLILIGMFIAAYQGNKLDKRYQDFQDSLENSINEPELFKTNEILTYLEFFCFLSTLFGEFFSHVKFESKLCRIFLALSFILSSVWMNFGYLFIYGSPQFHEGVSATYLKMIEYKQQDKLEVEFDNVFISFVFTWISLYQLRQIIFVIVLPIQFLQIYYFKKFILTKKEEIEKQKLHEMRRIYDELEQSQL